MANIIATNKTYNSISVKLTDLDKSYSKNDRILTWMFSTTGDSYFLGGNGGSIGAYASSSGEFVFSDLSPGTTYYLKALVSFANGYECSFFGKATTYPSIPNVTLNNTTSTGFKITVTGGNADGYHIIVLSGGAEVKNLRSSSNTVYIIGLNEGEKYTIVVYGYKYINGSYYENSAYQKEISATTSPPASYTPEVMLYSDLLSDDNCVGVNTNNDDDMLSSRYTAHIYARTKYTETYPYLKYRYRKKGTDTWIESSYIECISGDGTILTNLDMCCTYQVQAQQYKNDVNPSEGYTGWSDTFEFETGGNVRFTSLLNFSNAQLDVAFEKNIIDNLDCVNYDYYALVVLLHNGQLYNAFRYTMSDIKAMPHPSTNYRTREYCITEGAGVYKANLYTYTIFNGKEFQPYAYHRNTPLIPRTTSEMTVEEDDFPAVPTNITYTRIKKGLCISWNAAEKAASYNVNIVNADGKTVKSVNVTDTFCTVQNLDYSALYTVYISSMSSARHQSSKAQITAITAPAPPLITHSVEQSTINISWTTEDMTRPITYAYINLYTADNLKTPHKTFTGSAVSGTMSYTDIADGAYILKASTAIEYDNKVIQCVDEAGNAFALSIPIEIKTRGFYWSDYTNAMHAGGKISDVPYTAWNGLCDAVAKKILVGKNSSNSIMPGNTLEYASGFGLAANESFSTALNTYSRLTESSKTISAERFNIVNYIISSVSNTGVSYKYKRSVQSSKVISADFISLQNKINNI